MANTLHINRTVFYPVMEKSTSHYAICQTSKRTLLRNHCN